MIFWSILAGLMVVVLAGSVISSKSIDPRQVRYEIKGTKTNLTLRKLMFALLSAFLILGVYSLLVREEPVQIEYILQLVFWLLFLLTQPFSLPKAYVVTNEGIRGRVIWNRTIRFYPMKNIIGVEVFGSKARIMVKQHGTVLNLRCQMEESDAVYKFLKGKAKKNR